MAGSHRVSARRVAACRLQQHQPGACVGLLFFWLRQIYAARNDKARKIKGLRAFFGASGETRTLTLSPETDFESAASTDSATEAMAAQYREAPTVGQSGSWRGKHISGKLRGLSRVSPCVSPIFISTCPRP